MALSREEWDTLVDGLAESNNGENLDNFAVLKNEVTELLDGNERLTGRIDELEQQNGALKRENFKLFSRVGTKEPGKATETEPETPSGEEEVDYLSMIIDEKGKWK